MDKKLFFQAMTKYISGLLLVSMLLFLPAGTFAFPQAWILLAVLFLPMALAGVVMMRWNPDLLRRRLNMKEEQEEQKGVIFVSGLMFLAAFILAGLNYRFQWYVFPLWISCVAAAIFLMGYLLFAEVLRENTYLSRTVEIQEDQKVIDTGLYGIVRHPMYMSTLILFLAMPVILGSPLSFVIMLLYIPIIGVRMNNEEKVLEEGLEGYTEYKNRVRYRVFPFIW